MKVLVINSRYFLSAGPEKYMFNLKKTLERAGHEFIPFSVKNKQNMKTEYEEFFAEPIGGKDKVYYQDYKKTPKTIYQILEREFYSFHVKKKLDKLIKKTKPDIAYILHHFNKLSPSIIDACKNNNLPTVMRISDFFLVCPEAHLFRENNVCEECIEHSLLRCIRHGCIKNSYAASIIKTSATYLHRKLKIYQKLDGVVCPSPFTLEKLGSVFDKKKLHFVPTLIENVLPYNDNIGDYMLFVGRLEPGKGVLLAMESVAGTDIELKIAGTSSTGYEKLVKEHAKSIPNVKLLGHVVGKELQELYSNARVVIVPSLWYENLPNVALEGMQHSKPIVTTNLGSLPLVVKNGYNGYSLRPDRNIFRKHLKILFEDDELCRELGKNSYDESIRAYSPKKHLNKLMRIFESVGGVK